MLTRLKAPRYPSRKRPSAFTLSFRPGRPVARKTKAGDPFVDFLVSETHKGLNSFSRLVDQVGRRHAMQLLKR